MCVICFVKSQGGMVMSQENHFDFLDFANGDEVQALYPYGVGIDCHRDFIVLLSNLFWFEPQSTISRVDGAQARVVTPTL